MIRQLGELLSLLLLVVGQRDLANKTYRYKIEVWIWAARFGDALLRVLREVRGHVLDDLMLVALKHGDK